MAENKRLMTEFPPVTTEQWEEVIHQDLRGADYERRLVWRTDEGFNVRPYYRAENLEGIEYLGAGIGEFPYVRGTKKCNNWRVCQSICAKDLKVANKQALSAIEGGVEMLNFVMGGAVDSKGFDQLLKGIDLTVIELAFCGRKVGHLVDTFFEWVEKQGVEPSEVRANFGIDPIVAHYTMRGTFGCSQDVNKPLGRVKSFIEKGEGYKELRYINVSGENFHNSGSTIVQELAFSLSAGHEYLVRLMELGVSVDDAATSIRFSMAVSSNYFMEIAKFRAARMLWANIVNQYKPECDCAMKVKLHAVTSLWNMTVYDPYVNMLRATTEAMSAAIGSVASLEVMPFNVAFEEPTEFSRRISRNVQLLLKHESHFDRVTDPAGGSYYIETLTDSISKEAWRLFKEVEAKGGYIKAFDAEFIQNAVEEAAAKKDMDIATRRKTLLGTNQYPNFGEVAAKEITEDIVSRDAFAVVCGCGCSDDDDHDCKCEEDKIKHLTPYRGAMAFEQMRLETDRSGKQPTVFMLTCGTLGMARARSQFSGNFFGCAGFKIVDNNFFSDVEEGIKLALETKADIVVVCAADDDYIELAPKVFEALGDKAITVVAGAPKSQPELEAKGIKNFISVRSNVLETLKFYQNELGI